LFAAAVVLVRMEASGHTAMWILPRDTVGKGTLWITLKENLFFELLEHKVVAAFVWFCLCFFFSLCLCVFIGINLSASVANFISLERFAGNRN
jgi:hypothetical protein